MVIPFVLILITALSCSVKGNVFGGGRTIIQTGPPFTATATELSALLGGIPGAFSGGNSGFGDGFLESFGVPISLLIGLTLLSRAGTEPSTSCPACPLCPISKNPCEYITCMNGGTCLAIIDGSVECCCKPGFTGGNCETEVCNSLTCNNCGQCVVYPPNEKAECLCTSEYAGQNCDQCSGNGDCAGGWTKQGCLCYKTFNGAQVTWHAAQTACHALAGKLVEPRTEAQFQLMIQLADNGRVWIGINRKSPTEMGYATAINCPIGFDGWNEGEPNNFGGNENCAEVKYDHMNDIPCNQLKGYICERSAPPIFEL